MRKASARSATDLQHDALRAEAARLRMRIEARACDCGAATCGCLRSAAEAFERHLRNHFATEERAWDDAVLVGADRTTTAWVRRLEQEHARFRERLERIRKDIEPSWERHPEASADLLALLDDLLGHELSEARLDQRSVFEDGE